MSLVAAMRKETSQWLHAKWKGTLVLVRGKELCCRSFDKQQTCKTLPTAFFKWFNVLSAKWVLAIGALIELTELVTSKKIWNFFFQIAFFAWCCFLNVHHPHNDSRSTRSTLFRTWRHKGKRRLIFKRRVTMQTRNHEGLYAEHLNFLPGKGLL